MTSSIDLVLLPLVRQAGKDRSKLPGLYSAAAPRRCARGRSSDRFLIYLTMEGNAPLSPKELEKLLAHMANVYFKTTGSATAAMRTVAEALNELLLKRNLNAVNRGRQAVGVLALGVVRFNHLYLLQSGTSHAYLISAEGAQQLYDPAASGRGLGLSRATNLRFHQAEMKAGDVLLISPDPPMAWNTTTLRNLHGLSLGDLYRRLARRAGGDFEATLMLAKRGKGNLRMMIPQSSRETVGDDVSPQAEGEVQKTPAPVAASEKVASAPVQASPPPPLGVPGIEVSPAKPPEDLAPPPLQKENSPQKEENLWATTIRPGISTLGRALGTTIRQAAQGFSTLIERTLPDEHLLALPGSTMAFIAVAVPIVVVAVSAAVYFQRGRSTFYETYMIEAQKSAAQAQQTEDSEEQHDAWEDALMYLDMAETYRITDDSQALRNAAVLAFDSFDKALRLSYRPAIVDGLPASVNITRIEISLENELYLLDGNSGEIYRAVFTGQGYSLDEAFRCGPVPGPLIVGPLVDMTALMPGHPTGATLMAMDSTWNLIYCIPGGEDPLTFQMSPPFDANLGVSQAFAYDSGDLYIFDPLVNSIWVYDGATEFRESPGLFFGEYDPPSMQDVVDLTVSDGKLYLLYVDGHLVTSLANAGDFADPAMYEDSREGYPATAIMPDASFREIQFAPPPDPSIYMLDAAGRSIYHFSLTLVYQRQYRPQSGLPESEATAFAVGPNRQAFIALGNQIFFALLLP